MTAPPRPAAHHQEPRLPPGVPLVGYLLLVPEGTDPSTLPVPAGSRLHLEPVPYGVAGAADAGLHVDTQRRIAEADGVPLDLTYLEFELLAHLAAHPHRVHTREHLVATLWGYSHVGDGRTVDVHVARLRRKLGPAHRDRVVTVRRVGYKYVPEPEPEPEPGPQAEPAPADRSAATTR